MQSTQSKQFTQLVQLRQLLLSIAIAFATASSLDSKEYATLPRGDVNLCRVELVIIASFEGCRGDQELLLVLMQQRKLILMAAYLEC
jgi:hypothetical protein